MKRVLIIAIFLFTVSLSGQAQTPSLESCAAIDNPAERYACYDKLAGRSPADTTKAGDTTPEAVDPAAPGEDAVEPAAPAETPAVSTVEPKPKAEDVFGIKHKQEQPDELKLKWTGKKKDAYGKWIITMENGQVWRQTGDRRFFFGNSEHLVIVSRGFGGGFFLKEPGSHVRIRVKRVR